ncbi:uncharacterized protein BcabD6B2_11050 [Babesia caballi]|uniref:Uncharacterized protein n=1 Tax=Babesia caballi TaxID=5871 RepID=A0AAV4LPD4_BABCB|nr:hypothetical protein, conserved [Babesia caballi]
MMFECGIYSSNLRFPRNVAAELNPNSARDNATQSRVEEMSVELTKQQMEILKHRKEHMRIRLPISGEVGRPSGGCLQELYYILEEHNRELMENDLSRARADSEACSIDKTRTIVLPTQLYRIFDAPSVTQRYRLFPSAIKSHSALVPGQLSTVTLYDVHRRLLVEQIRSSNVFGIPLAFIDPPASPGDEPEISHHACMCEFVDISDIDTSGKVVVRAAYRLSTDKILDSDDPVVLADVSLLEDERLPLRNSVVTHENARAIAKLYDRCNVQEVHLSRLEGRLEDVELVESREPFNEKLAHMIRDVPLDGNHELNILELTGFAALEFHADTDTRLWAANTRDTEERLACAKVLLEKKAAYLQERLSQARGKVDLPAAPTLTEVEA